MATNPLGPGKANATAYIDKPRKRYISARAERLKWTDSKYIGAIINYWFEQGCPAVDLIEQRLPSMKFRLEDYDSPETSKAS